MSLSYSIDRILSPDFGPCKSRASETPPTKPQINTSSPDGLHTVPVQSLCKSEDDSCKSLEMPPSTEMHPEAFLLSGMMFHNYSVRTGQPKFDAVVNGRTDNLLSPEKNQMQRDLANLTLRSTFSDCTPATPCSERLSASPTRYADFVDEFAIYKQRVQQTLKQTLQTYKQRVINNRNFWNYSEQPSSPVVLSLNLPAEAEQNKLTTENLTLNVVSTKETSSLPEEHEDTSSKAPAGAQPLTEPHQEEDNPQTDETDISCDTKPQVPEELLQNDDRCSSTDGRCSASSVGTLSSMAESESNHAAASSGLATDSFDETKTVVKECLSDDCVDSPPKNFSDTKVENPSPLNHKLLSEDIGDLIPPKGEGWPVWVYCNRYSARPSSGPRSRRQSRKMQSSDEKRCRTAFTMFQLNKLHRAFESNQYLCEKRRNELARDLQLTESQVKIWFQNRRAKVKKATGSKEPLATLLKQQGLYNHSTTKA